MMFAALFVLGCDKKDEDTGSAAGAASAPEGSVEQALAAANEESGGRIYDESLTEKACELLSPEGVGQAFGIPVAELESRSVLGCTYRWESKAGAEPMQFDARFSSIRVHNDAETAKRWFANATKGMSQEEAKQAMAAVADKAKEREEIDTKAKEKAVDQVGDAFVEFAGPDGIQFESVEGVGDEARLDLSDGGLWVRTGNLTFIISGHYGPPAPKPDMTKVGLQEMAKAALAVEREWVKNTMTKRKEDATKLAAVILKALP